MGDWDQMKEKRGDLGDICTAHNKQGMESWREGEEKRRGDVCHEWGLEEVSEQPQEKGVGYLA